MHNAQCIIHNRPPDVDVPEARPYINLLNSFYYADVPRRVPTSFYLTPFTTVTTKKLVIVDGEFGEFLGGVEDVDIEFVISNLSIAQDDVSAGILRDFGVVCDEDNGSSFLV